MKNKNSEREKQSSLVLKDKRIVLEEIQRLEFLLCHWSSSMLCTDQLFWKLGSFYNLNLEPVLIQVLRNDIYNCNLLIQIQYW